MSFGLGIKVANINIGVFKGIMTFGRPFARVANQDITWTTRREMKPPIQAHDLLDSRGTQLDVVLSLQQTLNTEPSGVAILSLQLEGGMNAAEVDFALRRERRA